MLGLANPTFWLFGIVVLVFLLGWSISKLNLFSTAYLLLVLALPLSIETEITKGLKLIFPSELLALVMGVALFFELITKAKHFSFLINKAWFIIPLVLVISIGAVFSVDPIISIKYVVVYLLYIWVYGAGMYYLMAEKKLTIQKVFLVYTVGYFMVVCWAVYHWSIYSFNPLTIPVIFEPFYADHTIFGASGVALFVFWFVKAFEKMVVYKRAIYVLLAIVAFVGLRMAASRAAFLSIPVGLIAYFILKKGFSKRHLFLMGLIGVGFLLVFQQRVLEVFQYNDYNSRDEHASLLEKTASVANVQTDVSNVERLNRWAAAINMFKEKPIIGFGPGVFQFYYIEYQEDRFKNRLTVENIHKIPQNSGGTVHSELFLYLSELGFLGIAAWLTFIIAIIWLAFSNKGVDRTPLLIISFAIMATYIFHGLFNNFLNTDKFAFLFWGVAGTLISEFKK